MIANCYGGSNILHMLILHSKCSINVPTSCVQPGTCRNIWNVPNLLSVGKWQVLSTRACNVLKMFSLVSRPPHPQCRQCLHSLTHLAPETLCCRPLSGCAQWCMESAVGSFGREVHSHSNTFVNIANRGILCVQINAIKAKIPELKQEPTLPRRSFPFGDGYALLWATDSTRRPVSSHEAEAIRASRILDNSNQSQDLVEGLRWVRLLLPNGQVSQCAWREKSGGEKVVRCARNVKVLSA